ncbi:MAG: hypothetical protein IJ226_04820 [Clostridia bacterium]|nr:hypothetical protein [Clostridia bacterium]
MKKFNLALRIMNIIAIVGMLVTFIVHVVLGSLKLMGANDNLARNFGYASMAFVSLHMLIGIILTIETLHARRKAGVGYFKENMLFWARRISGFAIVVFLVFHLTIFASSNAENFRLEVFNAGRLATQILLVVTIFLHVVSNARPTLITFGISKWKPYAAHIITFTAILLILAAVAFGVYFLRWQQI